MRFPLSLKPLPYVIATPWQYYQVVHMIHLPEQFFNLRWALFAEMGNTERFWTLLLHISEDILNSSVEHFNRLSCKTEGKLAELENFKKSVLRMNKAQDKEKKLELFQGTKTCKKEVVKYA